MLVDTGPCHSNPCVNGGTCDEPGLNLFTCTCAAGFMGATCDVGKIVFHSLTTYFSHECIISLVDTMVPPPYHHHTEATFNFTFTVNYSKAVFNLAIFRQKFTIRLS